MPLDLSPLGECALTAGTKGLPPGVGDLRFDDIGAQGWNLLAGDISLPAAVLKRSAIEHNVAVMQAYVARSGMRLAPHGKTTMCPALFDRQLAAGAWGITVATFAQLELCRRVGVRRILFANEIVSPCEIRALARMLDADPAFECFVLVDSVEGARRLQHGFAEAGATRAAAVLIEIGMDGGRCGCRSGNEALVLARFIRDLPRVELRGIEAYEGLLVTGDSAGDAAAVRKFLQSVTAALTKIAAEGIFAKDHEVILSAGGSAYFDLVALEFSALKLSSVVPVLRSGCYISHDSGFYRRLLAHLAERSALGPAPDLEPALEVWTNVLSRPEPGLAILSAGKRDVSFDIDLPVPTRWFRRSVMPRPAAVEGWRIFQLSDQHAFMRVPADADIEIGDLVCLGVSHPCTTFDKWPLLLEVDDDYRVLSGLRTFF